MNHRAIGQDGHILTCAASNSLSERHGVVLFGQFFAQFGQAIEQLMLQVEDGIVVTNGSFEQALGVVSGRWHNYLDAGHVEEPRFRAGRMERPAFDPAARWAANDHRRWYAAAPVKLARHVDDLVKAAGNEVDELHLGDGAHAHGGGANGGTDAFAFAITSP